MKNIIFIIIILNSLLSQGSAFSKKNDLGLRKFPSNTYTSSKGYGGLASFDGTSTNYLNSATWVYNKYTNLEFFVETGNTLISSNIGESSLSNYTLNSFGWISQIMDTTLTFGVVINPFLENVGKFSELQAALLDTNFGNITNYLNYTGAINEAKIGIAYQLNSKLKLSLDALYYFGSLNIEQKFSGDGNESWLNSVDEVRTTYYGLTGGVNAHYEVKPAQYIAASISFPKTLNKKSILVRTVQDTFDEFDLENNREIKIPLKMSFGYFGELNPGWMVSADYFYEGWDGIYQSINKFSLGIEKSASSKMYDSFWERSIFFAGTYFYNEAFKYNDSGNKLESINNFGITTGISMPFNQNQNRFSISFNYGKRGSIDLNGLTEDIFKVNFGLTLQELWYQPEIED